MTRFQRNEDRLRRAESLERLAIEAWPPRIRESLGGWTLRASDGVSKRANSVWTGAPYPESEADWLARAEGFAERHGIAPCFCVGDTSPEDLDENLEAAGYSVRDACFLMAGPAALIRKRASARRIEGETPESLLQDEAEEAGPQGDRSWLAEFLGFEGISPDKGPGYAAIFKAAGPEKTFARLRAAGETAAIGACVLQDGCAYVSSIVVASAFRRRGLAFRLMAELSGWASDRGAQQMYLQVLQDNQPAIRLYESIGFGVLSRHHYRIRER